MIAYLFYTLGSPEERRMQDLARQLESSKVEAKLIEADSVEGIRMTQVYDIMARPAVVLAAPDGTPLGRWQGTEELPLVTDISYLAHQM